MRINITSFGFIYGVPENVSFVVDARGIRNPSDSFDLRHLRGTDAAVSEQVLSHPRAEEVLAHANSELLARIAAGRQGFNIGIGCHMGRHRSVALAAELARRWAQTVTHTVRLTHRDIER